MSDNAFLRLDGLKAALSRVKTKVDSDIASAISESTISLTSLISSGDSSTLTNAKSYIDGIKTNNMVDNLEWVTASENQLHSYRKLGRKGSFCGMSGWLNPKSKPVIQIKDGITINVFGSIREAARKTGINDKHINRIVLGKGLTAGGYKWKYAL